MTEMHGPTSGMGGPRGEAHFNAERDVLPPHQVAKLPGGESLGHARRTSSVDSGTPVTKYTNVPGRTGSSETLRPSPSPVDSGGPAGALPSEAVVVQIPVADSDTPRTTDSDKSKPTDVDGDEPPVKGSRTKRILDGADQAAGVVIDGVVKGGKVVGKSIKDGPIGKGTGNYVDKMIHGKKSRAGRNSARKTTVALAIGAAATVTVGNTVDNLFDHKREVEAHSNQKAGEEKQQMNIAPDSSGLPKGAVICDLEGIGDKSFRCDTANGELTGYVSEQFGDKVDISVNGDNGLKGHVETNLPPGKGVVVPVTKDGKVEQRVYVQPAKPGSEGPYKISAKRVGPTHG